MENKTAMELVMNSIDAKYEDNLTSACTISARTIDEALDEFSVAVKQLIEDKINLNTKNIITPLIEKSIKKYDKSRTKYVHIFDKSTGSMNRKDGNDGLDISCVNEVEVYIISNYLSVINNLIVPKYTIDIINDIGDLFNKRCSKLYPIPIILYRSLEHSQGFLVYSSPSNDNCVFFSDVINEVTDMINALGELNTKLTIWDKIFKRKTVKAINDIFFTFSMLNTTV